MKKAVSILSILIILLSGFRVTLSSHFCGGKIAASKVSITGRIASCGMETDEKTCPLHGTYFPKPCCTDQIQMAGIVNIFTVPDSLSEIKANDYTKYVIVPVAQNNFSSISLNPSLASFYPPGTYSNSSVRPENICVFRI